MTFKYRYRKQIIITLIVFTLIGMSSFFLYSNLKSSNKKEKKENQQTIEKKEKKEEKKKEEVEKVEPIMVDVKGEVMNPGIYTLNPEKRVIDAIQMAGGLTNQADTSVLNLSEKLKDEMVIIVYSHYEVENFEKTKEKEEILHQECVKGVNALENNACIEEEKQVSSSNKVSINQATKEEFMQLEGIGESKANAIVEYRNTNGPFQAIEDIKNVSGIGDSLFDKIKENITL